MTVVTNTYRSLEDLTSNQSTSTMDGTIPKRARYRNVGKHRSAVDGGKFL